MRIVFMGTPDFAAGCLQALLDSPHQVVGVFCQPDKPKGRGMKLTPPPVKELALSRGVPVYQPKSLKKGNALEECKALAPDMIVVVAYGKLLPGDFLRLPPLGCINVHASLLPKYRGAGPIQWCILNGETQTGITTMVMDEGMDTGDMLRQAVLEIGENETAEELFDRLSQLGAQTLMKTVEDLEQGRAVRTSQDPQAATYAPMLTKDLSPIRWERGAREIHNQIRGLYSWPMATMELEGKTVKVCASRLTGETGKGAPGELMDAKRFLVCCGDGGILELLQVQPQGKRAMTGEEFLRGHRLARGLVLPSPGIEE